MCFVRILLGTVLFGWFGLIAIWLLIFCLVIACLTCLCLLGCQRFCFWFCFGYYYYFICEFIDLGDFWYLLLLVDLLCLICISGSYLVFVVGF